jgi:polysaccharide export outer membrane protein
VYILKVIARAAVVAACLSAAACSDLIPGLNLHEGSPGAHQYKIVGSGIGEAYQAVPAKPTPAYEVVKVDADVLMNLAQTRNDDALSAVPSLLPSNVPPEYRVGPGDVFYVTVWDHPELTAPAAYTTGQNTDITTQGRLVAADGMAFYPYVGTFKAAGLTAAELRDYITQHISRVVHDPQVDVRVINFRADRIEVTGEVFKPSTIDLDDTPKGVIQAIDACGGLTANASRRRLLLERAGVIHEIDLAGLLSGSRIVPNPALLPGDVLHVPDQSSDQVFVLGAVGTQAPVILQQNSESVVAALTKAGGINNTTGKAKGLLVFRPHRDADHKLASTVFVLDLSRPEGLLLASGFNLMPGDVLYVKATAFAEYNSIINDLLPTITAIFQLAELNSLSH